MDIYLAEPVPPFATAANTAVNTFTVKQNVSQAGTVPVILPSKLRAGSKLMVRAAGNAGVAAATTPTLQLGLWIGTRALAMTIDLALSSAITMGSGVTAVPWIMEWDGICTVAGASGSLLGQGKLYLASSLTAFNTPVPIPITAALRTVAIDTTIERAIGVAAAFSVSNVANQVQVDDLRAMILN